MRRFIQKKDDLDLNIEGILDSMLENPPSIEGTDFFHSDVSDMAHVLPAVESVLNPRFFTRATLIFRLLHHTLDIYLISPISEDAVLAVAVPDADREDPKILEHIWFLLFLGVLATGICNCLKNYLHGMPPSTTPPSSMVKDKLANAQPRQVRSLPNTQDARSGNAVFGATERENSNQTVVGPHVPDKNAEAYYEKETHYDPVGHGYGRGANTLGQRQNSMAENANIQSKKGYAVETHFRDGKFTGNPEVVSEQSHPGLRDLCCTTVPRSSPDVPILHHRLRGIQRDSSSSRIVPHSWIMQILRH